MAAGGMFDHLGGGFHRYCVDERWQVPHFEKMLYDNAMLAVCYLEAWQATNNEEYATVARRTLDYLLRDMTDPQGGFYSGEDADSEGQEGKFYLWSPGEIEAVLGPETGQLFCRVYDVTDTGNFEGRNILNLLRPLEVEAKLLGCEPAMLAQKMDAAREKLLAARAERIRPGRDEKVLVSWNSLAIDALARATRETQAAMVYLANPDNPMGSWWDAASVERFIAAVPATTMIMLDEAYGEFAPPGTLPPLDMDRPNLLRMRTFSKAYGLAGARVGYVFGEARNISAFNRIRNHFGISNVAQAAAIAALKDQAFLERSLAEVRRALDDTAAIVQRHGLAPLPTATNFVAVDCGRDGPYAQAILDGLAARGVFVRKPAVAGLDRCIRISAGTDPDRALLDQTLGEVLADLR